MNKDIGIIFIFPCNIYIFHDDKEWIEKKYSPLCPGINPALCNSVHWYLKFNYNWKLFWNFKLNWIYKLEHHSIGYNYMLHFNYFESRSINCCGRPRFRKLAYGYLIKQSFQASVSLEPHTS